MCSSTSLQKTAKPTRAPKIGQIKRSTLSALLAYYFLIMIMFGYWVLFGSFSFSCFLCPKIEVLFLLEFLCNQLAILTQCSTDGQAARYIFFCEFRVVFSDLFWIFRINLKFWWGISHWFFIQSTSNLGAMILRYLSFMLWLFFKNSQLFFQIYSWFSGSLYGLMSVQWYYMSDAVTFGVWIDSGWNASSVFRLGRPINPLNVRFNCRFNARRVLQTDVHH